MKKILKNWLFWLILSIVILLSANIIYLIFDNGLEKTNILTLISGWISGLATLTVGFISYFQARGYRKKDEQDSHFIDIVVENIIVDNCGPAVNVLGRTCNSNSLSKGEKNGFNISIYNYFDKPIFDVKVETLKYNNKVLVYDNFSPINDDIYGKSFMIKNDRMRLIAINPDCKTFFGHFE